MPLFVASDLGMRTVCLCPLKRALCLYGLRVCTKNIIFLVLGQNVCCGYSKEPFFEHSKDMLKLMGKKTFTLLRSKSVFILACELHSLYNMII